MNEVNFVSPANDERLEMSKTSITVLNPASAVKVSMTIEGKIQ